MTVPFKPQGYSSVSPYLIVQGAEATIAFLEQVFGAQRLRYVSRPDGLVQHAEVRIDDTVVMLADGPEGEAVPTHVHVYVPDVDATYAKAIAAGATSVRAPEKGHDPDKRGGFQDAGGTTWWVGTQVEQEG
jgi:uncharacterized glyoxalase superfamily protein PhnB